MRLELERRVSKMFDENYEENTYYNIFQHENVTPEEYPELCIMTDKLFVDGYTLSTEYAGLSS